jgi:hypothetical protein
LREREREKEPAAEEFYNSKTSVAPGKAIIV